MSSEQRLPIIRHLAEKLDALQRRLDHVQTRLRDGGMSDGVRNFMAAERSALEAALDALRYHRSEVQGIGDVVAALRRLAAAVEVKAGVEDAFCEACDTLKEWDS